MEELYENNNYPSFTIFKSILKENGIKKTEKEIKELNNKLDKNFPTNEKYQELRKRENNIKIVIEEAYNSFNKLHVQFYEKLKLAEEKIDKV
jgi:Skp family chaperone for outer membrane proteins